MTTITTPAPTTAPERPDTPEALRPRLRSRLLALPYRAFLQVSVHLLHAQGYTAARPAGRERWRGRNTDGGWDAEADFTAGSLGTLRCVAQVKQFDALTVAQRHVDELRGAALRANAAQALLITLSAFSPPARRAAQAGAPVVPVRLIEGDELLDLLIASRLGVRRRRDGGWALDEVYFTALRRFAPPRETSTVETTKTSTVETTKTSTAKTSTAKTSTAKTSTGRVPRGKRSRLRALSVTVRLDPPEGVAPAGGWRWEPGTGDEPR